MRLPLLVPALALLAAAPLAAQQENACHLVQDRNATFVGQQPNIVGYVSGPLLVTCDRGEQLRSDSAVVYQGNHEVQLYGRVDYQDPTRALTSDYATYNSQTGRLYARGSVVFTDRERGSTLRGPELEYFRQMEGRPDAQMIAPGRPHLTLVPKQDPGKARRDPMDVDGDRITTVGNRYMSAEGRVVIKGKDLLAHSAEAFYDADQDRLELRRTADIAGQKFTLRGDFIETTMKEGKVQRVLARTDAHLVSDRLRVDGPLLTLFFADDQLQRLVAGPIRTPGLAAAPAPAPARDSAATALAASATAASAAGAPAARPAADSATKPASGAAAPGTAGTPSSPTTASQAALGPRPVAYASGFRMQADSLEAILPAQQLQRVNAVGRAHAEAWDTLTAGPDGTRRTPPPAYHPPHPDSATAARNARRPGNPASPERAPADSASITAALALVPRDRDIIDADTIIGHFIQVDTAKARTPAAPAARPTGTVRPGAAPDTARPQPKTEIDRMQAFGSAHALYRLKPKQDSTARNRRTPAQPGINYVIGDTIDLKMAQGEVETAHVRGLKRGIYLDPEQPGDSASARRAGAPAPAADSAAARARPGTPAQGAASAPASGTPRATTGTLPARGAAPPAPPAPSQGTSPAPPRSDLAPAREPR